MTLVTQAVIFAAQAHDGAARKGSEIPYIVHPMEVVAIASTMTDDPQVLAAAALHDVMEDCGVTFETLSERFGVRVARLVCEESQRVCGDPCLTWNARKLGAVKRICGGCRAAKIIALSDKLSNMRAISRDFARSGEAVFQYKCDNYYAPASEGGIAWDDPALGIDWRLPADTVVLSEKDRRRPPLAEAEELFEYRKP